jgi:hypothetical protein
MCATEIAGFWKKHVCPDLSLYERLVQVGFQRKKKREKGDMEKLATSGLEFLEHRWGVAPVSDDRSTLVGSLSLHVLRTPSVVGPTLTWPRHGATLASPPCTVRPSFPSTLVGSRFSLSFPYRTPPRSFSCWHVACTPPCRANPIPSFFPTQARTGSAPWRRCSPLCDPLLIPPRRSTSGALHHHLRPLGYKCHLVCLSSIPPRIRSRAPRIGLLHQCLGGRSSEAVRKE